MRNLLNIARDRCYLQSLLVVLLCGTECAFAHVGHGTSGSGGFLDGFIHPITGMDHLVAMVAVGLWGAQLRAPAIWLLPITFPLVMAVGGVIGIIGVPIPGVDIGVALSGIVLGLLVALAARTPLWVAAIVVGAFGLLHGHAHGTAMPLSGSPVAFGGGFVMATGLLHLSGIVIGILVRWRTGAIFVRCTGAAIAVAGAYSLVLLLGRG